MIVKKEAFEKALVGFLDKAIATMPTTGHKFLAGLMIASSTQQIEELISPIVKDGTIDTDALRKMFKTALATSGDKVSFTVGDDRIGWLVKPVTVSFDGNDLESMILASEAGGVAQVT